jgi:hypothetical protein
LSERVKPVSSACVFVDVHRVAFVVMGVVIGSMAASCGAPAPTPETPVENRAPPPAPGRKADRRRDPDLDRRPPRRLLSIDWANVPLASDADAMAVWNAIAPTGADWEAKLEEIPVAVATPLAIALLHGGNFACRSSAPQSSCAIVPQDIADPLPTAGLADPCLRRILALWSLAQLDDDDVPRVVDALRTIAALPPPESQLVAAAIQTVPEDDHQLLLELLTIAFRAGQRALVNASMSRLEEPQLLTAVTKHHIEGALEVLSAGAATHRPAFVAAIRDEAIPAAARTAAIDELVAVDAGVHAGVHDRLAADTRAALIAATRSKSCAVAAHAARALAQRGDRRFVPRRPRTRSPAVMMRALCVLTSYERLAGNDEVSLFPSFVTKRGLVYTEVPYDTTSERTAQLIPQKDVVVPHSEELVEAFGACKATTCTTAERTVQFGFETIAGELWLASIEIADRPPCPPPTT